MTFEEWSLEYYGCDPAYFPESADAKAAWDAAVVNSKLTPDHIPSVSKMIPEGYVLVPVEPTEAMVEAGDALWDHHCTSIYEAMIQAAQEKE